MFFLLSFGFEMVGSDRSSMNINDAIFIIIVGEYIESIIIMNC